MARCVHKSPSPSRAQCSVNVSIPNGKLISGRIQIPSAGPAAPTNCTALLRSFEVEITPAPWTDSAHMKPVFCLGLLMVSLLAMAAQKPSAGVPRVFLFGKDYVRIEDWARANGGQARWSIPRKEFKASLPSGTFIFTVDSRRAQMKGTTVWLSLPVAFKNGSAHLGHIDLVTAINPLLAPPRNIGGRPVKHIVIDPGHGGRDPGNMEGKRQEKQYVLLLAKETGGILTKAGFKVSYTRTADTTLELPDRAPIARRRGADLLISLHFNSADGPGGSSAKGAETFCMTPARTSSTNARGEGSGAGAYPGNRFDAKNMVLAYQIQRAITAETGAEDRGVKRARFQVLRDADMPSVLIEAGFMTNPSDARRIYDGPTRLKLAQAIADGVVTYKKIVERK